METLKWLSDHYLLIPITAAIFTPIFTLIFLKVLK